MSAQKDLRLAEREEIRDVIHRYCRAADRQDGDLFRTCYHPDATDQHTWYTGSVEGFVQKALEHLKKCVFTLHRASNILIEFDGDRAFVETYVVVVHRIRVGEQLVDLDNFGRYCDLFEQRNGEWKIFHRLHLPDGDRVIRVQEMTGRRHQMPEGSRYFEPGRRDRSDASYLRFDLKKVMKDVPPVENLWEHYLEELKRGLRA